MSAVEILFSKINATGHQITSCVISVLCYEPSTVHTFTHLELWFRALSWCHLLHPHKITSRERWHRYALCRESVSKRLYQKDELNLQLETLRQIPSVFIRQLAFGLAKYEAARNTMKCPVDRSQVWGKLKTHSSVTVVQFSQIAFLIMSLDNHYWTREDFVSTHLIPGTWHFMVFLVASHMTNPQGQLPNKSQWNPSQRYKLQ